MREELRRLLRAARFAGTDIDTVTDDVLRLFGRGVDDQPAVAPDQPPPPSQV